MTIARTAAVLAALAVVATGAGTLAAQRRGDAHALPYTQVRYDAADARRAFAAEAVTLTPRSNSAAVTTLGNARDVLEVDVFGEPAAVRRTGFKNLPRAGDCAVAGHLALRWRGNVRAILNCDLVRSDRAWIARMDRALARLP